MADKRISQLVERVTLANNDVFPIVASGASTTNKVTLQTIDDYLQTNLDFGVTSVAMTVPTGLSVTGTPITTTGTFVVTFTAGYSIPTNAKQTQWDEAYTNRITSATAPLGIASNVISITQSGTASNGYLSSTDWNTFNSKQNALTFGNLTESTSSVLTITGGTSAIIGSGTSIRVKQATSIQDGYLSSTDWSVFDNKQNALSGTGIVKSTGGTITYLTDNTSNWDSAYNDKINSAAVTGTTTKTLTLTQQDGGTIVATWTDLVNTGTVTSVGVSMPSAFSVSNSPITSSGTIAITGAGTISQYIDGTGALQTFPSGLPPTGQAGGDLQGTYPNPTVHAVHGIDFQNGTPTADDTWVYGGSPAKWQHQKLHTNQITEDGNLFYTDARARAAISESVVGLDYNSSTGIFSTTTGYGIPTTASQTNWDAAYNDKINSAAVTGTTTKTLTLTQQDGGTITTSWTDDNTGTVTSVALATGTTGTDVGVTGSPITGAGTITLNIPTASATNRGALSSADWSTFNSKQGAITLTTTGTSGAATLVGNTLNIPNYSFSETDTLDSVTGRGNTTLNTVQFGTTITAKGNTSSNGGAGLKLLGWVGASKNWQIDTAFTSNVNELAFTPSTIDGGSTFTTPVVKFTSVGGATFSGTVTANAASTINGAYPQLILNNPSAGAGIELHFKDNGTLKSKIGTLDDINSWQVYNGGAIRFTINNSGNVGINTTSPSYTLDVNGTGRFTSTGGSGLRIYGASGTNQWDIYLNSTNLRFSDNTGGGKVVFDTTIQTGLVYVTSSAAAVLINRTGGTTYGAGVQYQTAGTNNWILGTGQTTVGTDFQLYNYNTGSGALNISYTNNAATFSSTITTGDRIWVGTSSRLSTSNSTFKATTASDWAMQIQSPWATAGQNYGLLIDYSGASPNGNGNPFIQCSDSTTTRFLVNSNGNVIANGATFVSGVTTGSPISIKDATPYIQWLNVSSSRLGYIQHNATNLVYNADTGNHVFNQTVSLSSNLSISGYVVSDMTFGDGNKIAMRNPSMSIDALKGSYFGYSSGYGVLIVGHTGNNNRSLAFGVDVSGNPSGAFSGWGSEYVWRNAASFITPNSSNNGYNTLLSWNSSGQITIPNLVATSLTLGNSIQLGDYTQATNTLTFAASNNGIAKINFYDGNNTEGLYIRTDGESYGGTMTFGARWDDDEGKIAFKMYQVSAGGSYHARVGVGTLTPSDGIEVVGVDNGITISSIAANRPVFKLVNGSTTMLKFSANGTYGAIADNTGNDYIFLKNGCLGVGTDTTAGNRFWVKGTSELAGDTSLYLQNSAGTSLMTVKNNNTTHIGNLTGGNQTLNVSYTIAVRANLTGTEQNIFHVGNTGSGVNDGYMRLFDNGTAKVLIAANNSRGGDTYFNGGGKFGIGLDTPQAILDVSHTAGTTNIIRVSNGSGNYRWRVDQNFSMIMTNASNVDTFSVTTAGALGCYTINSTGNITIDKGSPSLILAGSAYGNSGARIQFQGWSAASGYKNWQIDTAFTGGNELCFVPSTTAGGSTFTTSVFTVSATGTGTFAGDVVAYSDARLKTNVATIDKALSKVMSLRGVSYNRIDIEQDVKRIGVIAQEVQEVLPEVVTNSGDTLGVSYGNMVGLLIEAMKEQQKQIEELKKIVYGIA